MNTKKLIKKPVRFFLYLLLEIGRHLILVMPRKMAYRLASGMGWFTFWILPKERANFYQELSDGIRMGEGKCELMTLNIGMIADFIEERAGGNDVVVFEGKEAGNVLKKLMKRMGKRL